MIIIKGLVSIFYVYRQIRILRKFKGYKSESSEKQSLYYLAILLLGCCWFLFSQKCFCIILVAFITYLIFSLVIKKLLKYNPFWIQKIYWCCFSCVALISIFVGVLIILNFILINEFESSQFNAENKYYGYFLSHLEVYNKYEKIKSFVLKRYNILNMIIF